MTAYQDDPEIRDACRRSIALVVRKMALRFGGKLPDEYAIMINGPVALGMPNDELNAIYTENVLRAKHLLEVAS